MSFDPQALELNECIKSANPHVLALLSERGKKIFFPKSGILSQSDDAKGSAINATIGTALEDDGKPMALQSLQSLINLPDTSGFNYAPSSGRLEIRKQWKEMLVRKNPTLAGKEISLPIVTSALTHGLSIMGYFFIDEKDAIISPDLYWENYSLIFNHAYGCRIDTYPLFDPGAGFNVDGLRQHLMQDGPGKKIVILNFPNNPTGYTITIPEAEKIRDVLIEAANAGNTMLVIIDDAYFGLVFEQGIFPESMFSLLADAHERILAVKLDGPTKEDYVWGFRVGFVTFATRRNSAGLYNALEAKCGGAIRGNVSNCSNLGQTMLLAAYKSNQYDKEKREKFAVLKKRYRKIRDIFIAHPEYQDYFTPLPFNSGYFMCVKLREGLDADELRQLLIREYDTGVIATGQLLRIAFSSTPHHLLESLFENMYNAAKKLAG